jgi:UDP-N-acetyl-D-galactosamine dehydrogenase
VVLAGRRINDGMGRWLVEQLVLVLARRGLVIAGARVLVLGLSFKENCPDLRNTRVVDVIEALKRYGMEVEVVDPWVDGAEARREYGLAVQVEPPAEQRDAAVVATVAHREFAAWGVQQWQLLLQPGGLLLDLKGIIPRELQPLRL